MHSAHRAMTTHGYCASVLLLACLLGGCISHVESRAQNPAARQSAISNTDPCATRLHDICGPLLFYYATNHQLPVKLEDLKQIGGFEEVEYICPVSGLPYVYVPAGLP